MDFRRISRLLVAIALVTILPFAALHAHSTPNSAISFDIAEDRVDAEVIIPANELGYALNLRENLGDPSVFNRRKAALRRYLLDRFALVAPDGQRWDVTDAELRLTAIDGPPDLVANIALRAPEGVDPRRFTLDYRAVIDRVPDHFVLVFARSDYTGGRLSTEPRMLGAVRANTGALAIDLGPGSRWRGFVGAVGVGMEHIAIGHDHLLFLIALILPAPLIAAGRRWGAYGGLRHSLRNLLAVVTAFTIGHSLTLLGGAFLGWQLPGQPVEILIALSILISAIHAWQPIFPRREALVAAGFGLVHGLAFATLIADYGVESLQRAESILGFNLGIELVQLLVIAALLPMLILFARSRHYSALRLAGAGFAGIAATAWLVERLFGTANPVAGAVDAIFGYALWIIAALTLLAIALTAMERRQPPDTPLPAQ